MGEHYGRIVRGNDGSVEKIVEAKDCTKEQLEIKEINTVFFVSRINLLFENLKEIGNENVQNEYYLTDLVEIFNRKQLRGQCNDRKRPARNDGSK